jgi:hypothetical protein
VQHPLFNSISPGFPDSRKRVDAYIAQWRQDLTSLEAGDMGLGPEGALTIVLVTIHKRVIARYEAILEELEDRGLSNA